MRRELLACSLLLTIATSVVAQEPPIYWKKDHIYRGPGGPEIAVMIPLPTDQTPPTTPTGLTVGTVTSTSIVLSWNPSTDSGGSQLAGYKVYRQKIPTASNANLPVAVVTGNSFPDQPLGAHTQYRYTIVAFDRAENHSAPSTAVTPTTLNDTVAPSTPTNVTSQSITNRKVRLDWTGSVDTGGSGLGGYRVYRGGNLISGGSLVTNTWYEDTTVNPGTAYSYTLTAVDNDTNASAASSASNVTTFWLKDDFNQANANNLNPSEWTNWTYSGHPSYVWKIQSNRASTPQTEEGIWVNSVASVSSLGNFKATVSIYPANALDGLIFWASPSGGRYRVVSAGPGGAGLFYYANPSADLSGGTWLASVTGAANTIKVEATSATRTIKVYLDGVLKTTFVETDTSRPNTGSVGITAWQDGPYLLDPCDPNSIVYPPLSQADDFLLEVYP